MTRVGGSPSARGMTLIEVMVALAVVSLLSIGIVSSFRLAERTYTRVTRMDADDHEIMTAQRFLRTIIASAYPFQPSEGAGQREPALEGATDRLVLSAPIPQAMGSAGLYRYELSVKSGSSGAGSLVVRWDLDRNGASPGPRAAGAPSIREEVLLRGVRSIEWAYLEQLPPGSAFGLDGRQWVSSWPGSARIPLAVRLRVSFAQGDSRHWPELVVVPRVTDDANCQFDSVAQACRGSRL